MQGRKTTIVFFKKNDLFFVFYSNYVDTEKCQIDYKNVKSALSYITLYDGPTTRAYVVRQCLHQSDRESEAAEKRFMFATE